MKLPKGFTLIELLLVLTIISLMMAIGLVSYNIVLKNARDSRRQTDLRLIQSALEKYRDDQTYYPPTLDFNQTLTNATGISPAPPITKVYLNSIPTDPNATQQYLYKAFKSDNLTECSTAEPKQCVRYCLYALAENLTQLSDLCPDQMAGGTKYNLEVGSP